MGRHYAGEIIMKKNVCNMQLLEISCIQLEKLLKLQ